VIAEVVFVPSAPLLLTEYTGIDDAGAELRRRCVEAIREALGAGVDQVVVLAGSRPGRDPRRGPLGVRVGQELVRSAGAEAISAVVPFEAPIRDEIRHQADFLCDAEGRLLVVAVGDGSPKRGEKAPGHLDERAFAVDERWVDALANADTGALLGLDPRLCEELLVTGRAVWQTVGLAVRDAGQPMEPRLAWSGDPWGVMYAVARWTCTT
jgi:hypothetical protein